MKTKLLNFAKILALCTATLLAATSCKKDNKDDFTEPFLQIEPYSLTFGATETGVTKQIKVVTTAQYFTVNTTYMGSQEGWLTTVIGEGYINVTVNSANPGMDIRQATIEIVVAGVEPQNVIVTQQAEGGEQSDYAITLNPAVLNFPAAGSDSPLTSTITTKGNGIEMEFSGEDSWFMALLDGTTISVTAQPNTSSDSRSATLSVTNAQGEEATLTINQAGTDSEEYPIIAQPQELIFNAAAMTQSVELTTEGSGLTVSVSENATEWLTAEIEGNFMNVTAAENNGAERTATLLVSNAEGYSTTVAVTQQASTAAAIILSPATLEFDAAGDELVKTVTVTTTREIIEVIVAAEAAEWLSAELAGDILTVSVLPQLSTEVRSGTVSVKAIDGASATLGVVQNGLQPIVIAGTWQWSSLQSSDGNWNAASTAGGNATITAQSGGYSITGIAGSVVKGLGAASDATLHIRQDGDRYALVGGESFTKGKTYRSGAGAKLPEQATGTWEPFTTPLEITVENVIIDGVVCQRITFPSHMVADSTSFPNNSEFWGREVEVCCAYYETLTVGPLDIASPVEMHDQLVLTRVL